MGAMIWKIEFVFVMWKLCSYKIPLQACWQEAVAMAEDGQAIEDGYTPAEAVDVAVSYWGD